MKIAILSDIHANQHALAPVLEKITKMQIKKVLIAGDFVGYFFGASKVFSLLENYDYIACRGNHENILLSYLNSSDINLIQGKPYKEGILQNISSLNDNVIQFLSSLEHPLEVTINERRILLCHGSPWNINTYIYPNSPNELFDEFRNYKYNKYDLIITGNTHVQFIKRLENVILINPGSIGQNRIRGGYADWAVVDTDSLKIDLYSEHYDTSTLQSECQKFAPHNEYLQKVILR